MAETIEPHVQERSQAIDLLRTTSRLIGVLEREIDMLRQMKPDEMQALQEQKIVLAAAYESQLKALSEAPDALAGLDEGQRQELRQTTQHFQQVLAENERTLRAAKRATDGLLKAIVGAVEQQTPRTGYAANGRERPGAAPAARSVAIDQRF